MKQSRAGLAISTLARSLTKRLRRGARRVLGPAGLSSPVTLKRTMDVRVRGRRRSYLIHLPANHRDDRTYPLVIVLHGALSTGAEMEERTGFSLLADREGFVVAYPNGAFGILGLLQHWNAGFCCGRAARDQLDDVGFLQMVIRDILGAFPVDHHRVYMTGFSNGGMLTYLFAERHPEVLAAAAPLGASIGGRASDRDPVWVIPRPGRSLPLLIMHGLADRKVPYEGGISPVYGGTREFSSVLDAVDFWIRANRADVRPEVEAVNGGTIERITWRPLSEDGAPVVLYSLQGWDHRWPGLYFTAGLGQDHPLRGFDAAEIIWGFFREHSRL